MNNELMDLRDRLQLERKEVVERLTKIDDKLSSINTVFELLKEQHGQADKAQLPLLNIQPVSDKFKGLPFKKSVHLLLESDPEKMWTPKEIFEGLLKEGFKSNSINFRNTARTMLMHMRKKGEVTAVKTERSYLYSCKKKGSASHMDEAEPKVETGGLGERFKPAVL